LKPCIGRTDANYFQQADKRWRCTHAFRTHIASRLWSDRDRRTRELRARTQFWCPIKSESPKKKGSRSSSLRTVELKVRIGLPREMNRVTASSTRNFLHSFERQKMTLKNAVMRPKSRGSFGIPVRMTRTLALMLKTMQNGLSNGLIACDRT